MQESALLKEENDCQWVAAWESLEPHNLLSKVFERFGAGVALCTSFQATGMAVLDMAWRLNPRVRIFTIDTGRLPQETYEIMDRVRERYNIQVEVYFPDASPVEHMVRQHGANLFYRDPNLRLHCCQIRKVQPLRRVLTGLDAWITGLRKEQSATRTQVKKVEIDQEHNGILKINPLADWTEQDTWAYLRTHEVPYHAYYDRGYTSIGCAPCTRPIQAEEDSRAGRWWWEQDTPKECGLHYEVKADGQFACKPQRQ